VQEEIKAYIARWQAAKPSERCELQKGVDTISSHEGFSTKEYRVGGRGNKTIGYGHEVLPGEKFSQGITAEYALDLLEADVKKALEEVQKRVKVPLKQHQLDALVSYVYNTGSIGDTQLLEKLNAGDFEGAAREMCNTARHWRSSTSRVGKETSSRTKTIFIWL